MYMHQVTTMIVWKETIVDYHLEIMTYWGYLYACLDFPTPNVHFLTKGATPQACKIPATGLICQYTSVMIFFRYCW